MREAVLGFALSLHSCSCEGLSFTFSLFLFFFNLTEQNFYYTSEISELFCALKSSKDSC